MPPTSFECSQSSTEREKNLVTHSRQARGYAWKRPDGGSITLLPLKNNNPYETARDAAREATGLARIMWTAWGGRGKAQSEEDQAAGRIIWSSVHLRGVEYGFVLANGNSYSSPIDLIGQARAQAADGAGPSL